MNKKALLLGMLCLLQASVFAQKPSKLNSNQIYEKLQKLNFLGSALYIAAHPDDENTRLIAYLANKVKARTAYLSLTRGDGGQNLIGSEIRELLGVIRTQELLAARGVDGGEQRFSRANDFGYSKHPDETLEIWDKKKVLADVVWAIRTFKPDVIINRFDHRTPGTTHGHHTTSAMLSVAAFDMAADKSKYPEQLNLTSTWQPERLFFNTSWWFYGSRKNFEKADKSAMLRFDIGTYYPLKGLSNNEVAAIASSQHLCQGFGRLTRRGSEEEYIEHLKGSFPEDKNNLFDGIDTTWNRIKGGSAVGEILYPIADNFDFVHPEKHVSALVKAYGVLQDLPDGHWKRVKSKELKELIAACAGLYLEATAGTSSTTPNSTITMNAELVNRSTTPMRLKTVTIAPTGTTLNKDIVLENNRRINFKETIKLGAIPYSNPYWLNAPWSLGMYEVPRQEDIGKPENDRPVQVSFTLEIGKQLLTYTKDLVYRYSRRDKGELYEPFEIVPAVTTHIENKVILFSDASEQSVSVDVRAGANKVSGELELDLPKGWKASPEKVKFAIANKGEVQKVTFQVTPTKNQSEGWIRAIAKSEGKTYDKELVSIAYEHIPKQTVLLDSKAKVVRLDIHKEGKRIGYIQGSGDAVPESLRQIGYTVDLLDLPSLNTEMLVKFDAVVVGIRAYNTKKELKFKQKFLLEYVKNGGNLVVQYNTNRRVDVMPPYRMQLSRDRVTDEQARVTLLAKEHPVLQFPNKIADKDFDGWVQERGLYFPNSWSREFQPILAMNDKGETPKKGSLLIAKYGKGNYIYTGLSFFRELPAGVPGAYKLFANLLSLK
ncbi:LmbE family protein [Tenacibaculum litopenaei]|uniref:PIG-L family deacetylase n=1 Tax=Tenacibaculum litopenaei TaxID=396016 RepID=UPI0038948A25